MYTMSNIKNLSLKIVLAEKNTITSAQPTNYQKFPYVKLFYVTTGDVSLVMKETTEKLSYNKTALLLGMTESAVQKKRKRILKKLKQMLKNS